MPEARRRATTFLCVLLLSEKKMAPRGRFELPTFRLTAERSTIELPGNGQTRHLIYNNVRGRATLVSFNLEPMTIST